jgi:predicted AlkP superfamily pyrophosphatase or phosphodiesterase
MPAFTRRFFVSPFLAALLISALATLTHAAPVLMISVDGMKPEYVTQADAKGMKLPCLRSLMRDGTYAEGVVGVWPTVTYPSHTSLVTGVSPVVHGISLLSGYKLNRFSWLLDSNNSDWELVL